MARRGRPPAIGRDELLGAALAVLRDRGVARLTTREVASRAGVSEGSIFYHFTDRQSLLSAVFTAALQPLIEFKDDLDPDAAHDIADVRVVLERYIVAVDAFLGDGIEVLMSAHGDAELRSEVGSFLAANDYGPHRGTAAIGTYLRAVQRRGVIDADIDVDATAYLLVSGMFLRTAQPRLVGHSAGVPSTRGVLDAVLRTMAPGATTRG